MSVGARQAAPSVGQSHPRVSAIQGGTSVQGSAPDQEQPRSIPAAKVSYLKGKIAYNALDKYTVS